MRQLFELVRLEVSNGSQEELMKSITRTVLTCDTSSIQKCSSGAVIQLNSRVPVTCSSERLQRRKRKLRRIWGK